MSQFIIYLLIALVFWYLGRCDYQHWLKFQREVIQDVLRREEMLIEKNNELRAEIVTLQAPKK